MTFTSYMESFFSKDRVGQYTFQRSNRPIVATPPPLGGGGGGGLLQKLAVSITSISYTLQYSVLLIYRCHCRKVSERPACDFWF